MSTFDKNEHNYVTQLKYNVATKLNVLLKNFAITKGKICSAEMCLKNVSF